jgi:hypothetical protein
VVIELPSNECSHVEVAHAVKSLGIHRPLVPVMTGASLGAEYAEMNDFASVSFASAVSNAVRD